MEGDRSSLNLYDAQICGTGKDACFQTCTPFLMMQTGSGAQDSAAARGAGVLQSGHRASDSGLRHVPQQWWHLQNTP